MEELSDTNILKLINERNNKNDNDKIKQWLTEIVDKSTELQLSTTPQYICKKVDASKLHDKKAPPSLSKHNKLSINDKLIWDQAYIEEYYGLHTQSKTWEYISESKYKTLRPTIGNALPTYAISIIKRPFGEKRCTELVEDLESKQVDCGDTDWKDEENSEHPY